MKKVGLCLAAIGIVLFVIACGSQVEQPLDKIENEPINSESDTVFTDDEDVYAGILNEAYNIIASSSNCISKEGTVGIVESIFGRSVSENLNSIGYAKIDIDNNGVEELIIADAGRILATYTVSNDKPVLVFEGWNRNRYYILDNGTIFNSGSGGAAYGVFGYYRVSENGTELEPIDIYFSDYCDDEMTQICWYHKIADNYSKKDNECLGPENKDAFDAIYFSSGEHDDSKEIHFDFISFAEYGKEKGAI